MNLGAEGYCLTCKIAYNIIIFIMDFFFQNASLTIGVNK